MNYYTFQKIWRSFLCQVVRKFQAKLTMWWGEEFWKLCTWDILGNKSGRHNVLTIYKTGFWRNSKSLSHRLMAVTFQLVWLSLSNLVLEISEWGKFGRVEMEELELCFRYKEDNHVIERLVIWERTRDWRPTVIWLLSSFLLVSPLQ